jgi:hypothetical protein
VFYNCLEAALIYSNFSKGLSIVAVVKATLDLARTTLTDKVASLEPSVIFNATKVIVSKAANKPTPVKL